MTQIFKDNGDVVPVTVVKTYTDVSSDLESKTIVLTGKSKGKGFTGVIKKWNFAKQHVTRGQSDKIRTGGAIGAQTPGRVFKGKKMAGRHGNKKVTLKGLNVVKVDAANNQIYVSGPVPGSRNSEVTILVTE